MDLYVGALSIFKGRNRPTNKRRWRIIEDNTQIERLVCITKLTKL